MLTLIINSLSDIELDIPLLNELKFEKKFQPAISLRDSLNPEDMECEISLKEPLTEEPDIEVDEPIPIQAKVQQIPKEYPVSEESFSSSDFNKNKTKPASKYKGSYKKRSKRQKLSSSQEDSGSSLNTSVMYSRDQLAGGKNLRPKSILKKPNYEEDTQLPKT